MKNEMVPLNLLCVYALFILGQDLWPWAIAHWHLQAYEVYLVIPALIPLGLLTLMILHVGGKKSS